MAVVSVRPERAGDAAAVREVLTAAFGRSAESDLVEALRTRAGPWISLVAEAGDVLVGHIAFSGVVVEGEMSWPTVALGPMGVMPAWQGRGIGGRLVRAGLACCRELGHPVVFVLGHAAYYPRFGFRPAAPLGLDCPWPVADDVWLVAELAPGALVGRRGRVRFDPAFDGV